MRGEKRVCGVYGKGTKCATQNHRALTEMTKSNLVLQDKIIK